LDALAGAFLGCAELNGSVLLVWVGVKKRPTVGAGSLPILGVLLVPGVPWWRVTQNWSVLTSGILE